MGKVQSDGIAEDLIRTFCQLGSAEIHLKGLVEIENSKLENGSVKVEDKAVLDEQLKTLENLDAELMEVTNLRRDTMLALYNLYKNKGDKTRWCVIKHLGIATTEAFESWQASDNDANLYNLWLSMNKCFIKQLTRFLGVEITDCAACFSDMMKGEK